MAKVAPSILSADFLNLGRDIEILNASEADYIHLDIMDGTFVPNISFGFPVCKAVSTLAAKPLDAHLMVVHPERWFETLASMGCRMVSFHQETARALTQAHIDAIHALGMKAGVAINPDIPVQRLYKYIGKADFFVIMSVFAGFGGQKFIYESLDRIEKLKNRILECGDAALIEVDGGVNPSNASSIAGAGADILVAGSSVFGAPDPAEAISVIRRS